MAPAAVFFPYRVPCGPRSTSTRSISTRSPTLMPARPWYTPSMNTPTLGSMPALFPTDPMPRIRITVERVSVVAWILRLGTNCPSRANSVRPESSRKPDGSAAMEIGTSCSACSRLLAVTVISSMPAQVSSSASRFSVSTFAASAAIGWSAGSCACAGRAAKGSARSAMIRVRARIDDCMKGAWTLPRHAIPTRGAADWGCAPPLLSALSAGRLDVWTTHVLCCADS